MTKKITQTEKKYLAHVGKLYYNKFRHKLCLVERVYRAVYGNKFRYDLCYYYEGTDTLQKKVDAKTFLEGIGTRYIEIKSEEEYNKALEINPDSILR